MNQALVSDVLDWLIEPSGECDRTKLITWLNQARERMYQLYAEIALFEINECFEVQTFCVDCNACSDAYSGVTLPREYQTVEAMWYNDSPVELFSSWREWQRGMSPYCACGLEKVDVPGLFSSERDPLPKNPKRLSVHAMLTADIGKTVTIRGVDVFGVQRVQSFQLKLTPQFTENAMRSLAAGAGFTKTRTEGGVVLAEEGGRMLSVYAPDETMPGYKRIKISGIRANCARVNIRGARRYFPVFRESDVVECDNRTAFEEMTRFLKINRKQNKDRNDIAVSAHHFNQAKGALLGDRSREIGKSTSADLRIETPSFGPHALGQW